MAMTSVNDGRQQRDFDGIEQNGDEIDRLRRPDEPAQRPLRRQHLHAEPVGAERLQQHHHQRQRDEQHEGATAIRARSAVPALMRDDARARRVGRRSPARPG